MSIPKTLYLLELPSGEEIELEAISDDGAWRRVQTRGLSPAQVSLFRIEHRLVPRPPDIPKDAKLYRIEKHRVPAPEAN